MKAALKTVLVVLFIAKAVTAQRAALTIDSGGAVTVAKGLAVNGNLGIGIAKPGARLTIRNNSTDPGAFSAGKALFVSGVFGPGETRDGGIEFLHDNLTQGIGFGYNTIYASGSNPSQNLNLIARGSGNLTLNGDRQYRDRHNQAKLDVAGDIRASGTIHAGANAILGTAVPAGYYQDAANGAYRAVPNGSGYFFQSYARPDDNVHWSPGNVRGQGRHGHDYTERSTRNQEFHEIRSGREFLVRIQKRVQNSRGRLASEQHFY